MDISTFRQEYPDTPITKEDLNPDPVQQFTRWFDQACKAGLAEPNAMSLATVDQDGKPSLRTVLLKFFDEEGFVFFTNYGSKKAREIAENPQVSLLFPWVGVARQVVICGTASKVSMVESARYFSSRPRESQLGAWVSQQSSVISSRQILLQEFDKLKQKFLNGEIPLPDFWGGFRVVPETIEFWHGQTSRLHDRFLYSRDANGVWRIDRLAP